MNINNETEIVVHDAEVQKLDQKMRAIMNNNLNLSGSSYVYLSGIEIATIIGVIQKYKIVEQDMAYRLGMEEGYKRALGDVMSTVRKMPVKVTGE